MENFSIESASKTILVNNVELKLDFDDSIFMENLNKLGVELQHVKEKGLYNTKDISMSIDNLFGENTCLNVFGCKYPNIVILIQFIDYVEKFVNKYSEEYVSKISEKYSADRIGDSNV